MYIYIYMYIYICTYMYIYIYIYSLIVPMPSFVLFLIFVLHHCQFLSTHQPSFPIIFFCSCAVLVLQVHAYSKTNHIQHIYLSVARGDPFLCGSICINTHAHARTHTCRWQSCAQKGWAKQTRGAVSLSTRATATYRV